MIIINNRGTFCFLIKNDSGLFCYIIEGSAGVMKKYRCICPETYPWRRETNKTVRNKCIFPTVIIKISKDRRPGNSDRIFISMHESTRYIGFGAYIGKEIIIVLHERIGTSSCFVKIK